MTNYEIIEFIKRRIQSCELALHDLYTLDCDESIKIDIIRLEEQIATYKDLLLDIF